MLDDAYDDYLSCFSVDKIGSLPDAMLRRVGTKGRYVILSQFINVPEFVQRCHWMFPGAGHASIISTEGARTAELRSRVAPKGHGLLSCEVARCSAPWSSKAALTLRCVSTGGFPIL